MVVRLLKLAHDHILIHRKAPDIANQAFLMPLAVLHWQSNWATMPSA
jgi:hypothetical protein